MTPTRLHPVRDNTLRAQIVAQLHGMVTSGRYAPGERLTESALATELGVSRAPLREAIRELADRGILVSQPYRGLFVRPVSETDLRELYSMRTALEQFAFKLAWDLRTPSALSDLRERFETLIASQTGDDQSSTIEREVRFHSWVYELSGHHLLLSHWNRLVPLVQIYLSLHQKMHGSQGQFRHMSAEYVAVASGDSLEDMLEHIEDHMRQGLVTVIAAVPNH
jgi:DNA-binding GntR family transcriptional regulator